MVLVEEEKSSQREQITHDEVFPSAGRTKHWKPGVSNADQGLPWLADGRRRRYVLQRTYWTY